MIISTRIFKMRCQHKATAHVPAQSIDKQFSVPCTIWRKTTVKKMRNGAFNKHEHIFSPGCCIAYDSSMQEKAWTAAQFMFYRCLLSSFVCHHDGYFYWDGEVNGGVAWCADLTADDWHKTPCADLTADDWHKTPCTDLTADDWHKIPCADGQVCWISSKHAAIKNFKWKQSGIKYKNSDIVTKYITHPMTTSTLSLRDY